MIHNKTRLFSFYTAIVTSLYCFIAACENNTHNVKLEVVGCKELSKNEIERILFVEIRNAKDEQDVFTQPTFLEILCKNSFIKLNVKNEISDRSFERTIDTSEHLSVGYERVVSIAAGELVLSLWHYLQNKTNIVHGSENKEESNSSELNTDFEAQKLKQLTVQDRKELKADKDSLKEQNNNNMLFGQFSALWKIYPTVKTNFFGGEFGGGLQIVGPMNLYLAVGVEGGRVSRNIGTVSVFSASAVIFLGVSGKLFSSSVKAGGYLGFRGGLGRLNGKTDLSGIEEHSLFGGIVGPAARFFLSSTFRPAIGLSIETGYMISPLSGAVDGTESVDIKGVWISVLMDILLYKRQNR